MTRPHVTMTCTPLPNGFRAIECDTCGVLGLLTETEATTLIHTHLMVDHHCDPTTVAIRNFDMPEGA